MASPELQQQQEKLRRAVDEWRCRSHELLVDLRCDPYVSSSSSPAAAAAGSRSSSADPIRLHVWPLEHSDLPSLLESDNVDVAKFVTVLSYDCSEISRLCQYASRNLYRQLLLFGHRSSSQEVLLEGEPQKAFGRSLSLFMELYEIMSRMTVVLRNLLQQLDSIYSQQDKNGRPYQSFKNVSLRSIFASLGEGLSMFLVLDEILKQNGHVRGYLSLFARMLSKVKLELDTFGITVEDVDCLDQVVCQLEKLLDNGLFQGISSLSVTLQKVRSNRKLIDACTSCIHDGLLEILARLDTWKEYPFDRRKLLHHVALFLFLSHTFEFPEKKLGKVIVEMLQVIPLVYVEGGIQFMILDLINSQSPHLLSSWSTLREAAKEHDAMKKNYLTRLHEMHSRDWQAIKDALSCWVVSFQSTVYPLRELSKSDAGLRLQLKLIIQCREYS